MNTEALFIFLILLFGLMLCSFLGGNCGSEGFTTTTDNNNNFTKDTKPLSSSGQATGSGNKFDNYNHYTGSSTQLSSGTTFYGQHGTTAVVVNNSDGAQSLQITLPGKTNPVTFNQSNKQNYTNYVGSHGTTTKFYGPNGAIATIIQSNNGQHAIKVETSNGVYYYNVSGNSINNNTSTQYYGSTGSPIQHSLAIQDDNQYYGPYGGTASSVTGPYENTGYNIEGPDGNSISGVNISGVNTNKYDYSNSLPPGIPRSQIPSGQEDLYILKSQIVPPVCPVCPVSTAVLPRQEPCPPCPPCARCPEPSFECKKVPNYNAINNESLPIPILSDFSQFGM